MTNVEVIRLDPFLDHRGSFINLWTRRTYDDAMHWAAVDVSVSHRNVLRGIHGDKRTKKLVTCVYGLVFCAVVNPADHSHQTWTMGTENMISLRIPKGFGVGILVLSDVAVWHYIQSQPYAGAQNQFTIAWNDPAYAIKWPVLNPILSERDRYAHSEHDNV